MDRSSPIVVLPSRDVPMPEPSATLSPSNNPYDITVYRLPINDEIELVGSSQGSVENAQTLLVDLPKYLKQCKDAGVDWAEILGTPRVTVQAIIQHAYDNKNKVNGNYYVQEIVQKATSEVGKRAVEIIKETFEQLKADSASKTTPKETLSRRGEHVINNGVLSIYENILDQFLCKIFDSAQRKKIRDGLIITSAVDREAAADIQTELVAHFTSKEIYVDANAVTYGVSVQILRFYAVEYLTALWRRNKDPSQQGLPLQQIVDSIIENRVYVDVKALARWKETNKNSGKTLLKYTKAVEKVETMLKELVTTCRAWVRYIEGIHF